MEIAKICVRRGGVLTCPLTPPAVHPANLNLNFLVREASKNTLRGGSLTLKGKQKLKIIGEHTTCCPPRNDNFGCEGGSPPIFFGLNLNFFYLERQSKIQNRRQIPSGSKVSGRKKKEIRRIMPSLVATMSASARTVLLRTHFARTNRVTSRGLFYLKA